jgi:hypothetical protein
MPKATGLPFQAAQWAGRSRADPVCIGTSPDPPDSSRLADLPTPPMTTLPLPTTDALSARLPPTLAGAERTLADQLAAWLALRIDEHALKPGTRLPSIRRFADDRGVSRSTVVEAYDRLIAAGYAESRRGAGFFVRARRPASTRHARARRHGPPPRPRHRRST